MEKIADYALIGDCHSAALVGRSGSIDWTCWPRFDSPSVFAAILDEARGGRFVLAPKEIVSVERAYVGDTNVLATRFTTRSGTMELVDCMPVEPLDPGEPARVTPCRSILRRGTCIDGEVEMELDISPRFEYGAFIPRFTLSSPKTAEIVGGADALYVRSTHPLAVTDSSVVARRRLRAGEQMWIETQWTPSHERPDRPPPSEASFQARLDATLAFWREWIAKCSYDGEYASVVRRSALTLKALTYAPTGAVVAAPTTSLPEEIGGERNWDYRYTWIRDATLTLTSLFVLGFRDEAEEFKAFVERTGAGRPQDLQIMYGIGGERSLPERELNHLDGHRSSRPVRIGNGAVKQMQLDAYGQLLEAAYLFGRTGGALTDENWRFLSGLADIVCSKWSDPDHGIWEMRDEPRHFVHSKLNCWLALDRGMKIADVRGDSAAVARWKAPRDAIAGYLLESAAPDGWFHQAVGVPVPDASTLLVPALGLLPSDHPITQATVKRVMTDLSSDGLVHRYLASDGLGGGEGAFLLCSFWLVDCLTHAGRLDDARSLLERLLSLGNDVGLFAEEADPVTGEALGNFPQAFTHMGIVTSCAHLSAAVEGKLPGAAEAHNYTELAIDRLAGGPGGLAG
ncbi:MAG: glycoside hydrolase family 15 protein [Actinomycetota bacterium]